MAVTKEIPQENPPIFLLPVDGVWIELLKVKQSQYAKWLEHVRYQPPEARVNKQRYYSHHILEELFKNGEVNTWDISKTLEEKQGRLFNLENFEKACAVVDVYTNDKEELTKSIKRANQGMMP